MSSSSSRKGQPCALCGTGKSSKAGEHVLPGWLLDEYFNAEDGPFTTGPPGVQEGDPDAYTVPEFQAIKLACCEQCNVHILNERFEMHGREPARVLIEGRGQDLSPDDACRARLWVLKTWVLLTHPQTEFKNLGPYLPGVAWQEAPSSIYSWLINGEPPPVGLSAWAYWQDGSQDAPDDTPIIDLPTIVADGTTTRFRSLDLGLRKLSVTLIYHPGWDLAHPAEADGSAIRLWPSPTESTTIPALPSRSYRPVLFRPGAEITFKPGTYDCADLPALAPGVDPVASAGDAVAFVAAPRIGT